MWGELQKTDTYPTLQYIFQFLVKIAGKTKEKGVKHEVFKPAHCTGPKARVRDDRYDSAYIIWNIASMSLQYVDTRVT